MRVICPSCLSINNVPKKDSYLKANCGKCKESLLDNKPINLTNANFDEVVVNSEIPVIVDFWAPWCGPCKMFAPIFDETSKKYALKAVFAKLSEFLVAEPTVKVGAKVEVGQFVVGEKVKISYLCSINKY